MLGSLHTYRRWLKTVSGQETLSLLNHGIAGAGAGFTVSFVAAPIEHVKVHIFTRQLTQARLQVQYSSKDRIYSGPLDAYKKIVRCILVATDLVSLSRNSRNLYWFVLHNHVPNRLLRLVVHLRTIYSFVPEVFLPLAT
jgi:hypothetical protein